VSVRLSARLSVPAWAYSSKLTAAGLPLFVAERPSLIVVNSGFFKISPDAAHRSSLRARLAGNTDRLL